MNEALFQCREYTLDDYPMLCSWWDIHGVGHVPSGYFPKGSFIMEADKIPVASACLYLDNSSPMAWLAWLTTNPKIGVFTARKVLGALIDFADMAAKNQNRQVMFVEAPTESLKRLYLEKGFILNHPTVHLFRGIS